MTDAKFVYTAEELSVFIEQTYCAQCTATVAAQHAADELTLKRSELATIRDAVILRHAENPKAMGGNEAARDAFLRSECMDEHIAVTDAENALQKATRVSAELASKMDHLKLQLRVLEVAKF